MMSLIRFTPLALSILILLNPFAAQAGQHEGNELNEWAKQRQAQLEYVRKTGKKLDFCYRQQFLFSKGKITEAPKPGYTCIPSAGIGGGGHG